MPAPGVIATINTQPIGQPAQERSSDAFFGLGWTTWGPTETPTLVTSWADFQEKFGGLHPNSELANAIWMFFRQGGQRAWICRAKHSDFAVATKTLKDLGASAGQDTVRVDAKYPSSSVDIKVAASAIAANNTVTLTFSSVKLNRIEKYENFKLTFTTSEQDALNVGQSSFNSIATINAASKLVKLTDLTSNTASPNNVPRELAATALTGGVDTIGSVVDADFATAISKFASEDYGAGQIAILGFPTTANRAALVSHAETFKRIALLEHEETSVANVLTLRATYDSSYAAMYYPAKVQMLDFAGSGIGKNYSPLGAIAAIFAQAEFDVGIHKSPANYRLLEVTSLLPDTYGAMTDSARLSLNEKQVNAIAYFPEQGIKVYGARVVKSYGRITAIHEQRVLNAIYYRLKRSLQEFVFQPANQSLFRELRSVCTQYMRELYRAGALYSASGNEEDAYSVVCDTTNNTADQLAQNKVTVDVGVHIVGMAEMIFLNINSVPLATDLTAIQ